jgi:hypothetical protein
MIALTFDRRQLNRNAYRNPSNVGECIGDFGSQMIQMHGESDRHLQVRNK